MSGKKADQMRTSFEDSAKAVALMGGSLKDAQQVQEGFANETGRARTMTAKMVEDMVAIGRGTGLGVEEAVKLGAQYELMGIDVTKTTQMVQDIVDTSERMGINTTKVLKGVNDNFKRLQTYSFQGGVKGMMKMSQYATKLNIDMNQALNAADIAKSLEGAIDLAAKLQVMGGEFAKGDPFELLFLSRNDPEKFTEKINNMTKGLVTLRKKTDGTFEKFISPADRDRMASVEKSLGLQNGELTQQALRMYDIQKMKQNMLASPLSKEDQEAVSGAAIFNSKTNSFEVKIGSTMKNISDLTSKEAKMFVDHQRLLSDRAKDSLTFQESLEAMLASFKTTLLPMLRGFGELIKPMASLAKTINSALDKIDHGILAGAGKFLGVVMLLGVAIKGFLAAGRFIQTAAYTLTGAKMGLGSSGGFSGMLNRSRNGIPPVGGTGGNTGGSTTKAVRGMGTKTMAAKGAMAQSIGKGKMMAGAGIGVAAAGIGVGIGAAAFGVSKLAEAMQKLDATQIAALPWVITSLGVAFAAFTIPLIFVTRAAAAGSFGLWSLGAAALGIGAGIGIAAAGIGLMATGLGELAKNIKGTGGDFMKVGVGIGAIALAMASMANPFTAAGIGVFAGFMGIAIAGSLAAANVANSMANMGVSMKGTKEDFIAVQNAVESISKAKITSGSIFAELANLLKTPLKAELVNSNMKIDSNITLEIDGQVLMRKVLTSDLISVKAGEAMQGRK